VVSFVAVGPSPEKFRSVLPTSNIGKCRARLAVCYAAANSTFSISVESSASAFELLTCFNTGQRCNEAPGASAQPQRTSSRVVQWIVARLSKLWRERAVDERRTDDRRSGKDRRSGVDTRAEEEKRLIGERRSNNDRRSGADGRSSVSGAPKKGD
jgi:hypothetical protein